MNIEQLTPWADVFRRSSLGGNVYYAKHQRTLFAIAATPFDGRSIPAQVRVGLFWPTKRSAAFLDGGVVESDPANFSDLRGAWVIGTEALRYLCDRMRLNQPRKLGAESSVPTVEAIHEHLRLQLDTQRADLERRLLWFGKVSEGIDIASVAFRLRPTSDA